MQLNFGSPLLSVFNYLPLSFIFFLNIYKFEDNKNYQWPNSKGELVCLREIYKSIMLNLFPLHVDFYVNFCSYYLQILYIASVLHYYIHRYLFSSVCLNCCCRHENKCSLNWIELNYSAALSSNLATVIKYRIIQTIITATKKNFKNLALTSK